MGRLLQYTYPRLTIPLLLTASGEKFGKSAGNAVWLDSARTSRFALCFSSAFANAFWQGLLKPIGTANMQLPALSTFATNVLCTSKNSARKLLRAGGVYVGSKRIDANYVVTSSDLVDEMVLLRSGKKNYLTVKISS